MEKKRQVNLEILRMIAMFMIIVIHIVNHGWMIDLVREGTASYYIVWFLFGIGFTSINLYILISGYFLITSKFSSWKVLRMALQVLFYALGITLLFWITGWAGEKELKILIYSVTPIASDFYWFATMYIGMYLMSPLLNRLAKSLTKRQFQCTLVLLFALFSVWTNVFYWSSGMNIAGGVAIAWFLVVYLAGAYIRLYYVPDQKPGKWLRLGIGFTLLIPVSRVVIKWILLTPLGKIPVFDDLLWGYSIFYQYNSVLVCIAAVTLFIAFVNMPNLGNGKAAPVIRKAAAGVFGVYLIHDHHYIREVVIREIGCYDWLYHWYLVPNILLLAIIIFVAGVAIDTVRAFLFDFIEKRIHLKNQCERFDGWLRKVWNG